MLASAANDSLTVLNARLRLNSLGRETTLALLDAQVESNNILIDWVNAIFDQRLGELDLAKETGALVPGPEAELAWARQWFVAADYRAPVREVLSSAARRQATAPPVQTTPAARPAKGDAPDFRRVSALHLPFPLPTQARPASQAREFFVSFSLDVKPFSPKTGKGW
jgi:hypothetical protein